MATVTASLTAGSRRQELQAIAAEAQAALAALPIDATPPDEPDR